MIPYGRQEITEEDISAVIETLKSDYITQGPKVQQFENAVAKYCGATYSVAYNSATSALHSACLSLGINNKSIVWTTPNSFVATSNCALYCGANVEFIDIDPNTYNLSISILEDKLEQAAQSANLPDLLIVVHFAGLPCDMEKIKNLSIKYGFKVIEDASHALGASDNGKLIGNSALSDITVFSFHPVKMITTGEGGMAVTNNSELHKLLRLYGSHGITKEKTDYINKESSAWYYEMQKLGFNYRMSDLHAALGVSQLRRLNDYVNKRNSIAKKYNESLDKRFVNVQSIPDKVTSSYHLYVINVDSKKYDRDKLFNYLREKDIGVQLHYIPIYRQPFYQDYAYVYSDFKNMERYYKEAISLPMFPTLLDKDQDYIIDTINRAFADDTFRI